MKIDLRRPLSQALHAAPWVLPLIVLALLAGWDDAVVRPAWQAERARELPLRRLIAETARLRSTCSDGEAARVGAQFQAAQTQAWPNASAAQGAARALGRAAGDQGWVAAVTTQPASGGTELGFLQARLDLRLRPGLRHPWDRLQAWMAECLRQWPQMSFSRLAVRADAQGRYSVRATFRLAYRLSHAEIPQ